MPFNGSGTFTRLRNWVNDAAANIRIRADYHDSEDDNFASGLSQCITKDGQTTVTANLPMAGFRHTGVGLATATTHYARYDQVQLGKAVWADAGGTADAITASYSPNTTTPVDGQEYFVRASAANATTTPTFSPDGNTARTIVKFGNQALSPGDIAGDGHELILRYRLSDTKYELLNPGGVSSTGNNTFSGNNTFTGKVITPDAGELTIASGAITVTGTSHTVDTEGDAASDDLATINGGVDGQILILRCENTARVTTLTSAGNINIASDIVLNSTEKEVFLKYDGALSKWNVFINILDDDTMATASATSVPSSESVKAYVDNKQQILHMQQTATSGTHGGTATAGSDETRPLNTTVTNTITGASHNTGTYRFTLPAGTYDISGYAVAFGVIQHKSKIRNITDGTDPTGLIGSSAQADSSNVTPSIINGRITIAAQKEFELQTRVNTTNATDGWGNASAFGEIEVYADVMVRRVV